MKYVYILESKVNASIYIGVTRDLKKRFRSHNWGEVTHTKKSRPWRLAWYCAFSSEKKAFEFEKFLKKGTGRAMIRKRLIPQRPE